MRRSAGRLIPIPAYRGGLSAAGRPQTQFEPHIRGKLWAGSAGCDLPPMNLSLIATQSDQ